MHRRAVAVTGGPRRGRDASRPDTRGGMVVGIGFDRPEVGDRGSQVPARGLALQDGSDGGRPSPFMPTPAATSTISSPRHQDMVGRCCSPTGTHARWSRAICRLPGPHRRIRGRTHHRRAVIEELYPQVLIIAPTIILDPIRPAPVGKSSPPVWSLTSQLVRA